MVVHVGINYGGGEALFYSSVTKITGEFKFEPSFSIRSSEFDKVDKINFIFNNIETKTNEKIGYVCICIGPAINTEVCNEIKEIGFTHGCERVQIIDTNTAIYFMAASQTDYVSNCDDIIWIIDRMRCYVWKNVDGYLTFITEFTGSFFKSDEICLERWKMKSKLNKTPNVVFYDRYRNNEFCSFLLQNSVVYNYITEPLTKGILIKARAMARDTVLSKNGKICENYYFEADRKTKEFRYQTQSSSNDDIDYTDHSSAVVKVIKYAVPKQMTKYDEKINAIGIDLGTTRCCVAITRYNKIDVVAIDNTGERVMPSYVSYDEENEKCGQVVVTRLRNYSESTIFDSKRVIGKDFTEVQINETWPFKVFEDNDKAIFEVKSFNGIIRKSPVDVAATLLKHMKNKVDDYQAKNSTEVVITVPATFKDEEKIATFNAAKQAGWNVIVLLLEPIAAAFAYFVDKPVSNNYNVLLFDLGGGTLDVCVLKVGNNQIEIISENGDSVLGGRDFDNKLMEYFIGKLKDEYGIDNLKDRKYKLMLECQNIKHNLSVRLDDRLNIDDFDSSQDGGIVITREIFENLSKELLDRTKSVVRFALKKAKYDACKIEKVLLVGGGCRMPMIKELLKQMFSYAEQCCVEQPDEMVAVGAAYYSYAIKTAKKSQCSIM